MPETSYYSNLIFVNLKRKKNVIMALVRVFIDLPKQYGELARVGVCLHLSELFACEKSHRKEL